MNNVLIVEDDLQICEILEFYLSQSSGYCVMVAHSAEEALEKIQKGSFEIILLDIMLPGMDGIALCEKLRRHVFCPIIFISCLNDDDTVVRAMNMGGDDYIIKPFRAPVLLARIDACLRRSRMQYAGNSEIAVRDIVLDPASHAVKKCGLTITLSPTEYQILNFLMRNGGRFVSFDEIYEAVWQKPSLGDVRTLFVHIRNLRKKIEDDPANPYYIKTHLRDGYIFASK
ncbi:MAG: response regulator transcription factor [Clostridia bacterium]|nr:response regulator transcription factor [Clostridia bacterium]